MCNRTERRSSPEPHSVGNADREDDFLDARSRRSVDSVNEWLQSSRERPGSFPSPTGRPSLGATAIPGVGAGGRSCRTSRPDARARAGGRSDPTGSVARGAGAAERDVPSDAEEGVRSAPRLSTRAVAQGRRTTLVYIIQKHIIRVLLYNV